MNAKLKQSSIPTVKELELLSFMDMWFLKP